MGLRAEAGARREDTGGEYQTRPWLWCRHAQQGRETEPECEPLGARDWPLRHQQCGQQQSHATPAHPTLIRARTHSRKSSTAVPASTAIEQRRRTARLEPKSENAPAGR